MLVRGDKDTITDDRELGIANIAGRLVEGWRSLKDSMKRSRSLYGGVR